MSASDSLNAADTMTKRSRGWMKEKKCRRLDDGVEAGVVTFVSLKFT